MKAFLKDVEIYTSDNLIDKPIVSIIIPTYCRGDNGLLERAVKSVIAQTFKSWELIVVDDGSKDGTRQTIMNLLKQDDRIIYIRNNVNSGLPALRVNQGIMHARGNYIAYQFDDDQWYENALEDLYKEIKKNDGVAVVYGKCKFIDLLNKNEMIFGSAFDYNMLQVTNIIANNTVLHSKEIPYIYGGYDCHVALKRLCDWDLWRRWAEYVPIIHVDKIVSLVEGNQDESLGRTCVLDQSILNYSQNIDRCSALSIQNLEEYEVDNLDIVNNSFQQKMIYIEHILPWYRQKQEFIRDKYKENQCSKKENILVIIVDFNATIEITVNNFKKVLGDRYNFIYMPINQLDHRMLEYTDIVMIERVIYENEKVRTLLNKVPSIYMLDDNLLKIYTLNRPELQYLNPESQFYDNIIEYIAHSSIVYCSTKGIQDEVFKYNKNTELLPTNILKEDLNTCYNSHHTKIKLAWIGSSSREEEFELFKKDLIKIVEELADKVELFFIGWDKEKLAGTPLEGCEVIPKIQRYSQYLNTIKKLGINIIISPIMENEFKNSKSPVKYLEATAVGAIGIYSNINVYKDIEDEKNGFLIENKTGALYEKINRIIELPEQKLAEVYLKAFKNISFSHTTQAYAAQFVNMIERAKLYFELKGNKNVLWIFKQVVTAEEYASIHLLESIGLKIKQININEFGTFSAVNNTILEYVKTNEIQMVIDSVNDPIIQYCVYQGHINYISYALIQTEWQLNNILEEKDKFNNMLYWMSFTLKYFNRSRPIHTNISIAQAALTKEQDNQQECNIVLNKSLLITTSNTLKKVNIKKKYEYEFTNHLDTLIGVKFMCYCEQDTHLSIEVLSANNKEFILRQAECTINGIQTNQTVNVYFDKPLSHLKYNNVVIRFKINNNRKGLAFYQDKETDTLMLEGVYKL